MVQIIPTFFFTICYCLVFNLSFISLWINPSKDGYWFTITLFLFFVINSLFQYLFECILNRQSLINEGKCFIFQGLLTIVVLLLSNYSVFSICPWNNTKLANFIGVVQFKYYLFFYLGTVIRWKYQTLIKLFSNNTFTTLLVSVYIIVQFIYQLTRGSVGLFGVFRWSVFLPFLGILGVLMLFTLFYRYRDIFSSDKIIGRYTQYIGKRTLDIYLLHFFFLPRHIGLFNDFFLINNDPLLEMVLGMFITIIVIYVTLLVSNIIRCSNTL